MASTIGRHHDKEAEATRDNAEKINSTPTARTSENSRTAPPRNATVCSQATDRLALEGFAATCASVSINAGLSRERSIEE